MSPDQQKLNYVSALLTDLYEVPSTWVTLSGPEVVDLKTRITVASQYVKEVRDAITNN